MSKALNVWRGYVANGGEWPGATDGDPAPCVRVALMKPLKDFDLAPADIAAEKAEPSYIEYHLRRCKGGWIVIAAPDGEVVGGKVTL